MLLREAVGVPVAIARQYLPRRLLRRRQLRGLAAQLAYCRQRVPAYRDDPRYAVRPLATLADLAGLPLLTKAELRARPAGYFATGLDQARCVEFSTSGTTGQRLRVLHDPVSHDYHSAALVRRFLATGRYLPTYRLSHLRFYTPPKRMFERFGLFRRHVILTSRPMAEIVAALLANRPRVIVGYPVHLRELIRALTPAQLAALRGRLRFVMTESELLVPEHRAAISAAFGVPVFDEYSAYEVLNVYYECGRGGRHISEDRVYVEIVDPAGRPVPDGVEGTVVVTAFGQRAMPLIRYVLGDTGLIEPGRCRCGRQFRTMRLTHGRQNDVVRLPGGGALYADSFLGLAMHHPGVAECFVRQDAAGHLRVYVVPAPSVPAASVPAASDPAARDPAPGEPAGGAGRPAPPAGVPTGVPAAAVLASVRARLVELAGREFPLTVLAADRVPLTAGGKGRFIVSEYQPTGPEPVAGDVAR